MVTWLPASLPQIFLCDSSLLPAPNLKVLQPFPSPFASFLLQVLQHSSLSGSSLLALLSSPPGQPLDHSSLPPSPLHSPSHLVPLSRALIFPLLFTPPLPLLLVCLWKLGSWHALGVKINEKTAEIWENLLKTKQKTSFLKNPFTPTTSSWFYMDHPLRWWHLHLFSSKGHAANLLKVC